MGRREQPLDPTAGPLQAFAHGLRELRRQAGSPTYRALAARAYCSASALADAASGKALPSLNVTLAYVQACGGDRQEWEQRWHEVAAQLAGPLDASTNEPARANANVGPQQKQLRVQPLVENDPHTVGPFRLHGRLGTGAMGVVYLGHTPGERPVAVKVIRPELADDPGFRGRFRREVDAVRRVHGLYTAPLVDADPDAPQPWLATAYIPGPSLREAITEHGPLPIDSVYQLAAGVAEALQAIHAAGVIHRDLKPSNVLLANDGPRVIDFGIAHAVDAAHLTATGIQIGTPGFMAPEQVLGNPVGPPTDVFALGALLTYAAARHPPFGEGPADGILYRIIHEPADLETVPEELRDVVEACLRKDPDQRPTPGQILQLCQARTKQPGPVSDWLPGPLALDISHRASIATAMLARPRRHRILLALASGVLILGSLLLIPNKISDLFSQGKNGQAQEQSIDLIVEADKASWRSGQGAIQWGSGTRIQAGTANFNPNAPLESGVRTERALATHPEWVDYGYVEGDFRLPRQIRQGDRFVASVGFFTDERCFLNGCRVGGEADFTVYVMGGAQGDLDTPRQIFTVHDAANDWRTPRANVDLSPYVGTTTLRIRVDAGPTAAQDWAGWWDMKVEGGR